MPQVWSLTVVQVSPVVQLAIGVQLEQVVSVVPEQPPEAYCPVAQVEQVAQLSTVPLTRYLLLPQVAHCESLALVHVRAEVHPATGEQATQAPLDRKKPLLHCVQAASLALVQVVWPLAQLATGAQLEQVVSVVPEQPPEPYWPAAHVEQVAQLSTMPLTRYLPLPQLVHCESLTPVQVTADVQPATGAQLVQLAVPLP